MTTTQPTTFRNHDDTRNLQISEYKLFLDLDDCRNTGTFGFASPEQAQRIALAILAGPGKVEQLEAFDGDVPELNAAVNALVAHFAALDARAAAEAEAAEIEAEAEQLYAAYAKAKGWDVPWWTQSEETQQVFRELAREARRLHTNKEARS